MNTHDETLRAFFDSLQTTQWLPKDELEAYQRRQLSHIVLHAARTVPFYKDRLAPLIRVDGSVDLSRWHEVPIVKRADMLERQSEMWSTDIPARHGRTSVAFSSGVTGIPVQTKWASLSGLARRAAAWRTYSWHEFDFAQALALTTGSAPWPDGALVEPWGPPWLTGPRGPMFTITQQTTIPRMTEWLHRKKARYFGGLSMFLPAVAEEAAKQGFELNLACMIGFGMQVTTGARETVRQLLDMPIVEMYSSNECGHMAHQCALGSLHVLSELVFVEILDENDRPSPPGVEGRVIVTVLHNSAQPVIRYEQGDICAFAAPCPCGRTLPVMAPIAGRLRHMFRFAGGARFSPLDSVAHAILKPHLDPSWYQIAQTGPASVEVRFVPRIEMRQDYQAQIIAALPRLLRRADISVSFKMLNSIPTPPGQKHVMFVNEHENSQHRS